MIRTLTLKTFAILVIAAQLHGCSSIKTVTSSNERIGFDLYRNKSKCEYSTRIYSGVSYNYCLLNAKSSGSTYNGFKAALIITDLLYFSLIADTLLLPVSITQQILYGNPKAYKPKSY